MTYSRKLIPCSSRPLSLYELYPHVVGVNPIYSQICHKQPLRFSCGREIIRTHACNRARYDSLAKGGGSEMLLQLVVISARAERILRIARSLYIRMHGRRIGWRFSLRAKANWGLRATEFPCAQSTYLSIPPSFHSCSSCLYPSDSPKSERSPFIPRCNVRIAIGDWWFMQFAHQVY